MGTKRRVACGATAADPPEHRLTVTRGQQLVSRLFLPTLAGSRPFSDASTPGDWAHRDLPAARRPRHLDGRARQRADRRRRALAASSTTCPAILRHQPASASVDNVVARYVLDASDGLSRTPAGLCGIAAAQAAAKAAPIPPTWCAEAHLLNGDAHQRRRCSPRGRSVRRRACSSMQPGLRRSRNRRSWRSAPQWAEAGDVEVALDTISKITTTTRPPLAGRAAGRVAIHEGQRIRRPSLQGHASRPPLTHLLPFAAVFALRHPCTSPRPTVIADQMVLTTSCATRRGSCRIVRLSGSLDPRSRSVPPEPRQHPRRYRATPLTPADSYACCRTA